MPAITSGENRAAANERSSLPLFTRLPKGHRTVFVDDSASEPLLQNGQYAVIDITDRKPRHGKLYAIGSRSTLDDASPHIRLVESGTCDIGRGKQRVWSMRDFRGWRQVGTTIGFDSRRIPVFAGLSDGPYETAYMQRKLLLGRVVGYAMSPLGRLARRACTKVPAISAQRKFTPIEAAYAVAQYLPADPALWVERCALADITLDVTSDGWLCEMYRNGDVEADRSQAAFLSSWLNLTPGGKQAVIEFLSVRREQ